MGPGNWGIERFLTKLNTMPSTFSTLITSSGQLRGTESLSDFGDVLDGMNEAKVLPRQALITR